MTGDASKGIASQYVAYAQLGDIVSVQVLVNVIFIGTWYDGALLDACMHDVCELCQLGCQSILTTSSYRHFPPLFFNIFAYRRC